MGSVAPVLKCVIIQSLWDSHLSILQTLMV